MDEKKWSVVLSVVVLFLSGVIVVAIAWCAAHVMAAVGGWLAILILVGTILVNIAIVLGAIWLVA